MPMYAMTVSSEQARAIDKAVELLLRLKIGQFDVLPQNLMALGSEGYCEHRDAAKPVSGWAGAGVCDVLSQG